VTKTAIDLSIVIPAYMEAKVIADSLDQLADWLDTHDYGQVEVIVVVAESRDGTAKLADSRAHRFRHFRLVQPGPRVGKGRDVRAGMLEASGRYRLFMDADLATPLHHLDDVATGMQRGDDVMIAVRNLWTIHHGKRRRLMSKVGNVLAQIILLPGIKDTQCGFKAFRADVADAVFARQTMLGWSFDAELLAIARRLGYRISTFEAPDWHDPKEAEHGLVGDSPLGSAVKTLLDLVVVRLNLIRGRYPKRQA
jgi:glycosyltransferase involved in cell wall biosynthesis